MLKYLEKNIIFYSKFLFGFLMIEILENITLLTKSFVPNKFTSVLKLYSFYGLAFEKIKILYLWKFRKKIRQEENWFWRDWDDLPKEDWNPALNVVRKMASGDLCARIKIVIFNSKQH